MIPKCKTITEKENLVALIWASNTCCTSVVTLEEIDEKEVRGGEVGEEPYTWKWPKLELDLKKGTWKFGNKKGNIGSAGWEWSGCSIVKYGLIGIYDRTKIEHLSSMIYAAKEATEERRYCD